MLTDISTGSTGTEVVLSLNGWAALSKVARKVGYHPNTLKRWGKNGMIDIKKVGRLYFVRPEQFAKVTT